MEPQNQVAKKEQTASERFMNKVIAEFGSGVGELALTDFQKRLAQNYFIAIDAVLRMAEEKRKKKFKNQDPTPVVWANVDMEQLARNVVSSARIGLDPAQDNHIAMMPFKNNALQKYSMGFIKGYRGIELRAKKYGLEIPDHIIVELVYSTDKFKSYKKNRTNQCESYDFEIVNDFDRGEIVGGFYYHIFNGKPEKNRLVVFTLKDILKRKPAYAAVEFWGGEKDIWEDGQKTGKKEHVDGWYEKMCYKTIYRAAYNDITIDSQKIDDDYMNLKQTEMSFREAQVEKEIDENANSEIIDIQATATDEPEPPASENPTHAEPEPEQTDLPPTGTEGPGF